MPWIVVLHEEFNSEFERLAAEIQDELLVHAKLLAPFGPTPGRPWVDRLERSRHANVKELRFDAAGGVVSPWRSTRRGGLCFSWQQTRRARTHAASISG